MAPREWRTFAAPAAFLLAVTIAVLIIHGALHHGSSAKTPAASPKSVPALSKVTVYRVRAGDTLASISVKTGIGKARLLSLNPKLQPTSLFIGEKIRLR